MNSKTQQLLALMANKGVLRPRELAEHGIPRECLRRLVQSGRIDRVGRGLYMLPEATVTEHHSLLLRPYLPRSAESAIL